MYFFRAYISATFGSQTKSSIFYDNNSDFRDHFNSRLCSLEHFAYICGITNQIIRLCSSNLQYLEPCSLFA